MKLQVEKMPELPWNDYEKEYNKRAIRIGLGTHRNALATC
jgi:hypothetical protein